MTDAVETNEDRAQRLCTMMNDWIASQTPAERDQRIQQFLAQAQTPAEKFRTLGIMMNFVIAQDQARRSQPEISPGNPERKLMDDAFLHLLKVLCGTLDSQRIPYAVTGSVVSSLFGQPLTSQNCDICIKLATAAVESLDKALPGRFYRSREAMIEAARSHTMANLIDLTTGLKVALSVLPPTPYYQEVMTRRRQVQYGPGAAAFWTVSPEDIILMKLLWRIDTRSEKQWNNALSVARTQGLRLDWRYLQEWAARLGVDDDLGRLRDEAGI